MAEYNFISPLIPKENIQGAHRGIGHISHYMGIDMVVSTFLCPRRSCISLMLTPFMRRWVAKLWRRVWTVACFGMEAFLSATPIADWIALLLIWCRLIRCQPVIVKELLKLR